jgi:hypothetical protein
LALAPSLLPAEAMNTHPKTTSIEKKHALMYEPVTDGWVATARPTRPINALVTDVVRGTSKRFGVREPALFAHKLLRHAPMR